MATRAQVEAKITAINDGGNNSAAEVRSVLTDLLNYTENVPVSVNPNVDFFHYWEENPINDVDGFSSLWYSFKGIKKQTVNFTFRFLLIKPPTGKEIIEFYYDFPDEIITELKSIILENGDELKFIVPGCYQDFYSNHVCLNLFIKEGKQIVFRFSNTNFNSNNYDNGFSIFTSIHFHCPAFNFK